MLGQQLPRPKISKEVVPVLGRFGVIYQVVTQVCLRRWEDINEIRCNTLHIEEKKMTHADVKVVSSTHGIVI